RDRHAVFVRAGWIDRFELDDDVRGLRRDDAVQPHERRVTDGLENGVGDARSSDHLSTIIQRKQPLSLAGGTSSVRTRSSRQSARAGWERSTGAHDAKLGRDVALEILPDAFAADPERSERF